MNKSYVFDFVGTAVVHAVVGGAVLAPVAVVGTSAAFDLARQSVLFFVTLGASALGMLALSVGNMNLRTGSEWRGWVVDADDPNRFFNDASAPYGFRIGFAFFGAGAYAAAAFFLL
ncbi:hypothetical protein [Halorubellus salinus]|uniref:hypothetical protein n=1 Tax=Halorubellus salinus TaxID=755309 RepID=UPI001D08E9EE|nr:hypothetical protein [Halorubellus salinus]